MRFLVFEGLDGSGKSTLMNALSGELKQRRIPFLVTREPGGTALGEALRPLILGQGPEAPVPMAELLMYEAGRAQHVDRVILPTLKNGTWVICDRFTASTLAFQRDARGLDGTMVDQLNQWASYGIEPDLTILLNISLEESQARLSGRTEEKDRFELEEPSFHQ